MMSTKSTKEDLYQEARRKNRLLMSKKKNLEVVKRKEQEENTANFYFIAWEEMGMRFLNDAQFAKPPENLRIHVFYPKGTQKKDLPKFASWMIGHESFTTIKEAIWVDLTAYVISLYAKTALDESRNQHCSKCLKSQPAPPKIKMTLVCGEEEKGRELTAVLKANKIDFKVIDGRKQTFLDLFQHTCHRCKLIFAGKLQADSHDKIHHNFLCHNIQCDRSRRGNGFYTRAELEKHLRAQKFCKFCPSDVFCSDLKYNEHVKNNHKPCPCSCKDYYEREEDLFEHYYALYPLPCLEEPACCARFKNIDAQAFHHKSAHGAKYPYFCMACFKEEKLVCLKTGEELLDHAEEKKHKENDFQFAIIPDMIFSGNNVA